MNNLTPFISMQNHHSLLYREEEREMFPSSRLALDGTCNESTLTLLAF
jgi:aryl-alcohol dehydrogenase-like predicted oxidoreductase